MFMTIQQCRSAIERNRLSKDPELFAWPEEHKEVLCAEFYSCMEHKPYDFSPFTQGEELCKSLGLSTDKIQTIRDTFYDCYEDELREIVGWAND